MKYLKDIAERVHALMEKDVVTAAMLTLPSRAGGDTTLHFTHIGDIFSAGDKFCSKIVTTYDGPVMLYDIHTGDEVGVVEFTDMHSFSESVKTHGLLEVETTSVVAAGIVRDQFTALVNEIKLF